MDSEKVFRHVMQAVAKVVFRIPPNDWSIFNEDLVPSKKPPKGLDADRAAWLKTLDDIERELHGISPDYRLLNLGPGDADATMDSSMLDICIYIQAEIMKLPTTPRTVARLAEKAAKRASA